MLLSLVVGLGNYLMRSLPLLLALRRGEAEGGDAGGVRLGGLLPFVGPSVVVALLVTSVLPEVQDVLGLIRTGIALLPTLFVATRSNNLGLTVLVGATAYWLISLVV